MQTATDTDWQEQVLAEVGDPNDTMGDLVARLWSLYRQANYTAGADLLFLYTKRGIINARLAEEVESTDIELGKMDLTDKMSQRGTNLRAMLKHCQEELERVEQLYRARRVPVSGPLTALAPTAPPLGPGLGPDANDPLYQGTAYPVPEDPTDPTRRGFPVIPNP